MIAAVAFGNGGWNLFDWQNSFSTSQNLFKQTYGSSLGGYKGGATNMDKGATLSWNQLKDSRVQNLARIMMMITDGAPNGGYGNVGQMAIDVADQMKDDGVTIFSVGFADAHVHTMKAMAGSKSKPQCNFCATKTDQLGELKDTLAGGFCETIITLIPPTPAPTIPPCASNDPTDHQTNKDSVWPACIGGLCNNFVWGNGSNQACVYYRDQADACDSVKHFCGCTCFRCCETPSPTQAPTPSPTPKPGDPTAAPTPNPTPIPTIKLPDQPAFVFSFESASDWIAAEEILRSWFTSLGYDYEAEWSKMVDEYRVKVVRGAEQSRYTIDNIFSTPFVPFVMQVWMPDKFYLTTTVSAAGRLESTLLMMLLTLLAHAMTLHV